MILETTDNMKKYVFVALSGLMVWAMTACDPNKNNPVNPNKPDEPDTTHVQPAEVIPTAFVRNHLIEEFTGQDCGYCPYGMDCVHEFVGDNPHWILVLHHYGYQKDNFSVAGSQNITNKLKVSGAPSISIDRAKTRYQGGNAVCFHPGYLPDVNRSQFDDSTYVELKLTTVYYNDTRKLRVEASGMVLRDDAPELTLTLLVKESGMVDYQQDYYNTFEGWQEFRHANAVRAYLSEPLGDALTLTRDTTTEAAVLRYSEVYEIGLPDYCLPENCSVVGFVSEAFQPVVQAAQQAIVGQGGQDILHGGITPVPVADYYPEPGENVSPSSLTGASEYRLPVAQSYYESYPNYGFNYWMLYGYNTSTTYMVNRTKCVPFAYLYVFTELSETSIPEGTYELNLSMEPGTAYAGYRDDEHFEVGGSEFYLASQSYLSQGYIVPEVEWLIVDGTLNVGSDGWSLSGHARNGSEINVVGTTAIVNGGKASAPMRMRGISQPNPAYSIMPAATDKFQQLPLFQYK